MEAQTHHGLLTFESGLSSWQKHLKSIIRHGKENNNGIKQAGTLKLKPVFRDDLRV